MRWAVAAGAVLLAGCASGAREPVPPPATSERARSLDCSAAFGPTRSMLARRRRIDAGAVDLLVPARVVPIARNGGTKLPILVRPGTGTVELRLRTWRAAGFTGLPDLRREAPPLPPDAVRVLRVGRCPAVPPEAQEVRGDPSVAYAALIAVTRDQCLPVDVTADGVRRRVRIPLGEVCSPG